MTIVNAMLALVVMIVVLQLWLLTATMNAYLGGEHSLRRNRFTRPIDTRLDRAADLINNLPIDGNVALGVNEHDWLRMVQPKRTSELVQYDESGERNQESGNKVDNTLQRGDVRQPEDDAEK
jgi:hypothetical protein